MRLLKRGMAVLTTAGLFVGTLAGPASAGPPTVERESQVGIRIRCEDGLALTVTSGELVFRAHEHEKNNGAVKIHGIGKISGIRLRGSDGETYKAVGTIHFRGAVSPSGGQTFRFSAKVNIIGPGGLAGRVIERGSFQTGAGETFTSTGTCHVLE